MNYRFKTLLLFILIFSSKTFAQFPSGGGRNLGQNLNLGHFYGKIIDANSNKAIDGASIQLYQNKFDTATKKKREVLVSGMLTDKRGEFSLENLAVIAQYKLIITAIGYKNIEQKIQ